MTSSNDNGDLPLATKVGYGAGELSSSVFWIVIGFWLLNFLTDEVGLPAGLAGAAIMIGKIWDGVTDPTVGFLSDRTRSRWGRRRPWLLWSAIPFGLAFMAMFTNPGLSGTTARFLYSTIAFMVLCTAYTCANVPYNSLLPDLTKDFDQRSSLSAFKSAFAVMGTLIGAGLALPIISQFESRTTGFIGMGAIFGIIIAVSVLMPFFSVRETAPVESAKKVDILRSNLDALKNRHFFWLLITWTLFTIAIVIVTGTLVYFFKYQMGNEGYLTTASLTMLVASMGCLPLAVKLSSKIGKRNTYIIGMALFAGVLMFFFAVAHRIDIVSIYIIMFIAGIGLSTHYVMPWTLVPDTVDYDYAESGIRREGVYFGLWTFLIKIGQALAGLLVGIILGAFGYVPDVVQTPGALLGIRLLIGPITAFFVVAGILCLSRYGIDRKLYDEIQLKIRKMENDSQ